MGSTPLSDWLGYAILTSTAVRPLWIEAYNAAIIPFTRFNNTIVMGSLESLQKTEIKGPADLLKLQGDLKNLREATDALEGVRKEIEARKSAFQNQVATLEKSLKEEMKRVKDQDLQSILKDLGLEEITKVRLAEAFLCPSLGKALKFIWDNMDKIRTAMPKTEKDKPVQTRIRAKGRDVIFQSMKKGPDFLLREARLSIPG